MTAVSHSQWPADLIEVLDQQRSLYQQLHGLSAEQAQLVDSGDPESLLSLMSQRQRLIDQLTQVSDQLEPYRARWSDYWSQMDDSTRTRVGDLVRQVQSLLEQIMAQDERDRATLAARRTQVAGNLQRMSQGASVNRAYSAKSGPVGARFTDNQG